MIEIGDNVHITADCSILQHDYSWAVIQRLTGEVLGSCGTVRIGNNVFVGQKSLILKGAEIGDNTIIGAGSVVTGRLDGNAVYAGAPAKKISSLEAYIDKRRKLQLNEAVLLVREYEETYGKRPPKSYFGNSSGCLSLGTLSWMRYSKRFSSLITIPNVHSKRLFKANLCLAAMRHSSNTLNQILNS